MVFRQLEDEVDAWVGQFTEGYWPIDRQQQKLQEEVGEVIEAIELLTRARQSGANEPNSERTHLGDELADVHFTAVCITRGQGLRMQDYWRQTPKYTPRQGISFMTLEKQASELLYLTGKPRPTIAALGEQLSHAAHETGLSIAKQPDGSDELGASIATVHLHALCIGRLEQLTFERYWTRMMQRRYARDNYRFERKDMHGSPI